MKKFLTRLSVLVLGVILMMLVSCMGASEEEITLRFDLNEDGMSYCVAGYDGYLYEPDWDLVIPNAYEGKPVTRIGDGVFSGQPNLVSVTIPDSVTSIGERAFTQCENLTSITVDSNNKVYRSEGNCVIETATKTLVLGCKASVIPPTVTSIGDYAFVDCEGLISVTIPNSVVSIGNAAFQHCKNLTSVSLPSGMTSIGYHAFDGCLNLAGVTIPSHVTKIGYCAFGSCNSLTEIVIPQSVASMENEIFSFCESLASIYCEAESQPEEWVFNWNMDCSATVYWGNEWHYVDGVPTVK